ncbi:MAG TPA: prolipoprotein diacylglyceryl transferase [Thermoanaerobaculia bacterium]|nr:prolipoprotein diacylglyceryl transferase [Thermoanaerobaculia bacterium]
MMLEITFMSLLAVAIGGLFAWAFARLPEERFQILAAVPLRKRPRGRWKGGNLTGYGLFSALASGAAAALFLLLAGAAGATRPQALLLGAVVLALGYGAARWVPRWVEGKRFGFTVGGAVFVCLLALPAALWLVSWLTGAAALPERALSAALAIAYVFGESLGRLACISFGCCYGKPVAELSPGPARWLGRIAFRFQGAQRKIAYASGLEGVPVVPIQAITAVVLAVVAFLALGLFLTGWTASALTVAAAGSQGWRVISELFRADYRGGGRLTGYQWMALAAVPAALGLYLTLPAARAAPRPDLEAGFALLWHPAVLLFVQLLILATFLYTGWSRVTGSTLSFRVYRSRV